MRLFLILLITSLNLLNIGCVQPDDSYEAKLNVARADLSWLHQFVEEYRMKKDALPDSLFQLSELKSRITKTPVDPWAHAYQYEVSGESFRIYSLGADGLPGGTGQDSDIEFNLP